MTRIIGGTAGGRRIDTPRGASTRPTSDRVREALFSAIESWCGSLQGLRFLDLYAGSGRGRPRGLVARRRRGHPRRAGPAHRRADHRQRQAPSASPRPTSSSRSVAGTLTRPPTRRTTSSSSTRPTRPPTRTSTPTSLRLAARLAGAGRAWSWSSAPRAAPRADLARRLHRHPRAQATARPRSGTVTPPARQLTQGAAVPRAPCAEPSVPGPSTRSPGHLDIVGRAAPLFDEVRRRRRRPTRRRAGCSPPRSGSTMLERACAGLDRRHGRRRSAACSPTSAPPTTSQAIVKGLRAAPTSTTSCRWPR